MAARTVTKATADLDGLRLLALSRIPRCGSCPRFRSLVEAHARGGMSRAELPGVPASCSHAVCAPLAERWGPLGASRPIVPARDETTVVRLRAS